MTGEVLIAEDDRNMQELIRRALPEGMADDAVRFFEDGRDILNYLFRLGPHRDVTREIPRLIVVDLDMPAVNGRAVVRILKSDVRFRHIPAVILTGNTGLRDKLNDLGADGFYIKPTDPVELKILFSEILEKWVN